MSRKLLVTGANGQFGRLVVAELKALAGEDQIIAGSRDPQKLADLGVETRKVDFNDSTGLEAAFAGVDRVLIVSTDTIDAAGTRLKQHQAAVTAAVKAGVGHIIYTSMPKPEPGSAIIFAGDHYGTEQAVKASGLPYTILRNSWYFENLKMSLPTVLASGHWYSASGEGRQANIGRADLAHAAAVALAAGGTGSRTYTLTGPQALTTAEIAAKVSAALARPITVINLTDEQLIEGLKAHGMPDHVAAFIVCFDTNTRLGGVETVTDDFFALTGRRPASFDDYLAAHGKEYLAG